MKSEDCFMGDKISELWEPNNGFSCNSCNLHSELNLDKITILIELGLDNFVVFYVTGLII